jgi:diguanylate cyclase (GGDEF)-like protein/PAS domain S-box-containing protein
MLEFSEAELINQPIESTFSDRYQEGVYPWIQADLLEEVEFDYCCKQKQLVQALETSQQRYELVVEIVSDGLWDWDLKTNQVDFSPRWKSMLGYSETEISNNPEEWFSRVLPKDLEILKNHLDACLRGEITQFELEYMILDRNGEHRWMRGRCLVANNSEGKIERLIGSQTDITQKKLFEQKLYYDAYYDRLTGLPNRVLFTEKLEQLIKLSKQSQDNFFAVLFLDFDRFKAINDAFGYVVGDELLVAIAHRLKQCVNIGELVAHLGGDKFAILLKNLKNAHTPTEVACLVQQKFTLPFVLKIGEVYTTVSIGIASSYNNQHRLEGLLRDAEIAMYQAKKMGKARYAVFEPAMQVRALEKLHLENDLRRAIQNKEFQLHYQPIVRLSNRQIVGFETLIRWQHPLRGLVFPSEFIPLAEETNLIVPMGWWILQEACRQMKIWQQQHPTYHPLTISVNISGKQFAQLNSNDTITQILQETGLAPHHLKLEITESEVIEDLDLAIAVLNKLKNIGIQISMDDFGTGYSSLSYLHRLPIDTLKIDCSFIKGIESDQSKLELVKTIISLANNLNLEVIAEGIETNQQRDHLLELNCEYGQGYLFSQPTNSEQALMLVRSRLNQTAVL